MSRVRAASLIAIALALPAEGLRQYAYYDPPGILTVCRGHTGPDVIKGKKYSLAECDAFMDADMRKAVNTVERCIPGLPENVLAAFADATYNMGPTIACDTKHSTAARYLKAGRLIDACNQLPRWNKANVKGVMIELPGLTRRRAEEKEICLGGST
ncbi:MAG TPA: lysozyme [Noviherbaspirillum sp.]|nr:lysozyme [Noviherbaspirillum sp.]